MSDFDHNFGEFRCDDPEGHWIAEMMERDREAAEEERDRMRERLERDLPVKKRPK